MKYQVIVDKQDLLISQQLTTYHLKHKLSKKKNGYVLLAPWERKRKC